MKNIGRIIALARPLYGLLWISAILIVLGALLAQVAPVLSKFIVDEIVKQLDGGDGDLSWLYTLIGIAFAMELVGVILTSISNRLGDHVSGLLRKYLIEQFYDKVLRLPQTYFDSEISGKISNQLSRGIMVIENFVRGASNFMLPTLLQSVFTIGVLLYYNVLIGVLVFVLFPVYLGISYASVKRWGKFEVEKNKLTDVARGRVQEVLLNMRLVKSFTNELSEWRFVSTKWKRINELYAKQSTGFHVFDFLRNFSLIFVLLCVNLIAFRNTFAGIMTLGELVLVLQLVNQARRPLFAMSFILTQIQEAESGAKEFVEVLDLDSREEYDTREKIELVKSPQIRFEDVSFEYETSAKVLKDITLDLKSPEKVAFVGHSGAGKTTTANLIMKLYEASEGEIYLNGVPYSELSHKAVRENMALVLQDSELFSTTVKENVMYGRRASEKEVVRALKQAQAWDFVKELPMGIDSEIGERGVKLSGGQKQRLQIARAILADSPILILDEATSSLDAKSEAEVQVALEKLMENRLTIIIAHRFSTIQNVDRVVVFEKGRIVDCGTPGELAKRPGIYHDLLKYQVEGNEKLLEGYELVG